MPLDWKQASSALRLQIGSRWMPRHLQKVLLDRSHILLAACSGGVDSVFLLLALHGWLEERGESDRARVLHFNHGLRGSESDEDERFVQEAAQSLELGFASSRWKRNDEAGAVSEDQARRARMSFFSRYATELKREALILTAHHSDDIVETMLMRLSRGSGLQGLCSPRSLSIGYGGLSFVRPLLNWRKSDLIGTLKSIGVNWREDSSNRKSDYYRNRLRHGVIPEWQTAADRPLQPGVAYSRELLEEDWAALEQLFEVSWKRCVRPDGSLSYRLLASEPKAMQRRALMRLSLGVRHSPGLAAEAMKQSLDAIDDGYSLTISIGESGHIVLSRPDDSIRLQEKSDAPIEWNAFTLPVGTRGWLPDGARIAARRACVDDELGKRIRDGAFSHAETVFLRLPEDKAAHPKIRRWQAGDAYAPHGKSKKKKLKELFIDQKVPRNERQALPVIIGEEGEILWVPGFPPNSEFLINEGTRHALQLTYHRGACTFTA